MVEPPAAPAPSSAPTPQQAGPGALWDSLDPLPLRLLVDRAMVEARRHFRRIYPSFALVLALTYGSLILLINLWTEGIESGAASDSGLEIAIIAGGCGGFFLLAMASYWALSALQVAVIDAVSGRPVDLARAWRFPLTPRAFGTLMLVGLAILAGAMLCFFPAIWVMIVLSFVFPVMVVEQRFGRAALGRSYRLVRYNPKRSMVDNPQVKVVLVLLVTWGLSALVGMLLKAPFQLLQAVLLMREATADPEVVEQLAAGGAYAWISALGEAFGALGTTAVQIYAASAMTLLYFDCRRRQEGEDLEQALDRLGVPRGPGRKVPNPMPPQMPAGEAASADASPPAPPPTRPPEAR